MSGSEGVDAFTQLHHPLSEEGEHNLSLHHFNWALTSLELVQRVCGIMVHLVVSHTPHALNWVTLT